MSVIVNPKQTTIGSPVSGGTAGSVLFVNAASNLAQDNPAFTYDATNDTLSIVGASDALRLIVKGNATQTANILDIRKSDDTVYWGFGGDGFIYRGTELFLHDTGSNASTKNVFIGIGSGNTTLTGTQNVGLGHNTLMSLTTGVDNVAIGEDAARSLTTGINNFALGQFALKLATSSNSNVAIGAGSLNALLTGSSNVAVGQSTGNVMTTGIFNTMLGTEVMTQNISGIRNTGVGYQSLQNSTTSDNTAVGFHSLVLSTSGSNNTALGRGAGFTNLTGSNNTYLGYLSGSGGSDNLSNTTLIGANTTVTQSNCLILGPNGSNAVDVRIGGTSSNARLHIESAARTTGSLNEFLIIGAAHTTLTASTEASDVLWNLGRTVQFSTGAITTQRAAQILAPTYSFVGASTITNAATFYIEKAPVAGTNATFTNKYALWVDADTSLGWTAT
jgi:hypothetical protein